MTDANLDAHDLAALVRSGEVSSAELVDEAIERIERHDPQINAVIHPRFEKARAEAAGPLCDGPFAGVPFLVKDLGCAMAGEPLTMGCRGLVDRGLVAADDSYLYRRFVGSGLITLGRTNTPEFGSTITTEPVAFGPSLNPWNLEHSTGGSSGGSAAAVAAGIVPMAHASDGGGSIRIPSSECGLVGLKPSRGRISKGPDVGESWDGATTDGVVTRTVRDSAAALDVMSGYETGDPYTAPPPRRPFADEVGADPGRLTIGFVTEVEDATVHPECVAAVESTAKLLESLGHEVAPGQPPGLRDPEFQNHFITILAASSAADFASLGELTGSPLTADDVEPDNWAFNELGQAVTAPAYLASSQWMQTWRRQMLSWWCDDGNDILVTPVIGVPPPKIGWLRDPELGTQRLTEIMLFTAQFNTSGQPAISLPLHMTEDGLPVGVQFVARYAAEDLLIRLASQIEHAQPWADHLPPIFG